MPRGGIRSGHDHGRSVTLIGKPDCHLCDDAQSVVERVCAETGVP
ncbi:glutaredoxin family protein, partial [Streptomyces nigra]